jgi:hypothetical protein
MYLISCKLMSLKLLIVKKWSIPIRKDANISTTPISGKVLIMLSLNFQRQLNGTYTLRLDLVLH